jgi:hypothetical protein
MNNILAIFEIRFWQTVNPLMSESLAAQKLVNLGYLALQRYRPMPAILQVIVWGSLGWGIGLGIGLVSAYLIR